MITPIKELTLDHLTKIAGTPVDAANARSMLYGLETYGYGKLALDRPHRLAHFVSQLMHESGRFRYDREVWGPTPAQKRYDTRTDLGNTAARDGDGELYKGRTPIQITGKDNYRRFTAWCKGVFPKTAPDFVTSPEAINADPWEGLAPLWFWEQNKINSAADAGDVNRVTKIINGGQNGLSDRRKLYVRTALVLLGYQPDDVIRFQMDHALTADGVAGPKTFARLHQALLLVDRVRNPGVAPPDDKPASPLTGAPSAAIVSGIIAALAAVYAYFFGG